MNEDLIHSQSYNTRDQRELSAFPYCVPTSIFAEVLDDKFRFAAHTHEDDGKDVVPVDDIDIDGRSL